MMEFIYKCFNNGSLFHRISMLKNDCVMINICQFKWYKFYFSGIVCYDKLEDMLKLVNSQVVRKDNKYVVQKYMGT